MASNYKMEIKLHNGTDFDTYYPKTTADVVTTSDGKDVETKIKECNNRVTDLDKRYNDFRISVSNQVFQNTKKLEDTVTKQQYESTEQSLWDELRFVDTKIKYINISDKDADINVMKENEIWIKYK